MVPALGIGPDNDPEPGSDSEPESDPEDGPFGGDAAVAVHAEDHENANGDVRALGHAHDHVHGQQDVAGDAAASAPVAVAVDSVGGPVDGVHVAALRCHPPAAEAPSCSSIRIRSGPAPGSSAAAGHWSWSRVHLSTASRNPSR